MDLDHGPLAPAQGSGSRKRRRSPRVGVSTGPPRRSSRPPSNNDAASPFLVDDDALTGGLDVHSGAGRSTAAERVPLSRRHAPASEAPRNRCACPPAELW